MTNIIGLKALRENVEKYASAVKRGESFTVVRRAKPLFRIVPPEEDEALWETVVDFTKFYKHGIPAMDLLKRLRALNGKSR